MSEDKIVAGFFGTHARRKKLDGPSDSGGGGGSDVEARVATLEKSSQEIREKLVRVETMLENIEKTMATKAEISAVGVMIAELKTTVAEGMVIQTRWVIGACLSLAAIAFTAAKFVS